ncbi:MAG: 50S ribosomal protein L10 [Phycisphaerales bacterium]
MSKQVKGIIIRGYKERLEGVNDAALISIRGLKAIDTTKIRASMRQKNIRITVMRNSLAGKAFEGSKLTGLEPLMKEANALCYGGNSVVEVARELVKLIEVFPTLELKGAILDGDLFAGDKGVKELSKYPTREEGIAQVITLIVSPAKKLVAQIKGPGSNIAGLVKAIEDKLEKGEAIAKKAG